MTKSSSVTLFSSKCNSSWSFLSFEICSTISNPSSTVIQYNVHQVARTLSLSFTVVSCSHIPLTLSVPLMWIISESPIDNSVCIYAFASPSFHLFSTSFSLCVRFALSAASGGFASFSMYFSSPRSHNMASMHHFYSIQLWPFNNSIWYNPDVYEASSSMMGSWCDQTW